jgi:cbb3-type cytochrome oxidase maturation protein
MSVVIVLMVLSILVAGSFLVAFLWSAKTGQFDDLDADAFRILIVDEQEKEIKNQIK